MKKKPAIQERAKVLAALNEKQGTHFTVLCSTEAKLSKEALAGYGCKHCDTHFSALASMQPFCVNCGSEEVELDEGDIESEDFVDDNELSSVQCAACGNHSIMSDVTASTLGGKLHCVSCGADIDFVPPTEDEEDLEEVDSKAACKAGAEDEEDEEDEELDVEESAPLDAATPMTTADEAGDMKDTELPKDLPLDTSDNILENDVETSMLKVMASKTGASFGLMTVNDRIIATLNNVPVAELSKADSGDNEEVFSHKAFAQAIAHAVKGQGVEKALAHYNFKDIVVSFPLKKEVDARVELALKARQTEVNAKLTDMSQDFAQCIALAASGMNKGFFKGREHPLKSALYRELEAAGVRSPTIIIDKVFSSVGGQYNKALIEQASELMTKSVELRNELAEAIDDTAYQNAVEDAEEDDVEASVDNSSLEDRLEGASLRKTETASVDVRKMHQERKLFKFSRG